MSHVLEHVEKPLIISTLFTSRKHLFKQQNGALLVKVPNAQSNTGCYCAFEDRDIRYHSSLSVILSMIVCQEESEIT